MKNRDEAAPAQPRRRRVGLLARAAFVGTAALAVAAPAQAATTPLATTNTIHVDDIFAAVTASTAPFSFTYVQVTYSCTASSGITQIGVTAGVGSSINGIYFGFTPVTCDGTSRKKTFRGGAGAPGVSTGGTFCLVNAKNTVMDGATTNWSGTAAEPPAVMPQYAMLKPPNGITPCG